MSYYVKLIIITLLLSVAAAEVFGPMVGMRGYIRPIIMEMLDGAEPSLQAAASSLGLAPAEQEHAAAQAESNTNTQLATPAATASIVKVTETAAFDSCVSAVKSVSLHPESLKAPIVAAKVSNRVYTFSWPKPKPIRVMGAFGAEENITAICRIGQDGLFRHLNVSGRELFNSPTGRDAVLGDWHIRRVTSRIDKSTNVTVSTKVNQPLVMGGTQYTPTLVLHCGENKTVSYIKLGSVVGKGKISVTSVIDGAEGKARWSISSDGKNIYQGSRYITLLRRLSVASRYAVTFTPAGQKPVSLEFNLSGIKAALNPLQESCRWR